MTPAATAALVCMAGALLTWPTPRWSLYRIIARPPGNHGEPRWLKPKAAADDPFDVAAAYDLFAVCLRAGLPVASAASIVATAAPPGVRTPLRATADLLALGADATVAWQARGNGDAQTSDHFEQLSMMARRSARAGSALSAGLSELAERTRARAHDAALEKAERAGVLISGPLGLCFLPAFICLGIVPVVIGLAGATLGTLSLG